MSQPSFWHAMSLTGARYAITMLEVQNMIESVMVAKAAGVSLAHAHNVLNELVALGILKKGLRTRRQGFNPYYYAPGLMYDQAIEAIERIDELEEQTAAFLGGGEQKLAESIPG